MNNNIHYYIDIKELTVFNELNDFVIKSHDDLVMEKKRLLGEYNRNIELIEELKTKVLTLENELSCDENIFFANYSTNEQNITLHNYNLKLENIITQNIKLNEIIISLDNKINESKSIIDKLSNMNYIDYLNSKIEEYKLEVLSSQEYERKRIARDIHDSVIQKLTNMIHKSEFAVKIMDVDNIRAKLELMTISNSIREIIDEMRNIIYNLRPMAFDDIGIDVIVERELINIKESGVKVTYDVIGDGSNVNHIVQITLIRIIQEACNNAIKHSNFTEFYVKIEYNDDNIEIYIKDNGKGFEIPKSNKLNYESKSGFGLSMMRERVYLLSGIIKIESCKEKGTTIYVKVPKNIREENKNAN